MKAGAEAGPDPEKKSQEDLLAGTSALFVGSSVIGILLFILNLNKNRASACPKGDGAGVKGGKCFKCGEKGHIAKKCANDRSSSIYRSSKSRDRDSRKKSFRRSKAFF